MYPRKIIGLWLVLTDYTDSSVNRNHRWFSYKADDLSSQNSNIAASQFNKDFGQIKKHLQFVRPKPRKQTYSSNTFRVFFDGF